MVRIQYSSRGKQTFGQLLLVYLRLANIKIVSKLLIKRHFTKQMICKPQANPKRHMVKPGGCRGYTSLSVSFVSKHYMSGVSGTESLVVCLSKYLPSCSQYILHDSSLSCSIRRGKWRNYPNIGLILKK